MSYENNRGAGRDHLSYVQRTIIAGTTLASAVLLIGSLYTLIDAAQESQTQGDESEVGLSANDLKPAIPGAVKKATRVQHGLELMPASAITASGKLPGFTLETIPAVRAEGSSLNIGQ